MHGMTFYPRPLLALCIALPLAGAAHAQAQNPAPGTAPPQPASSQPAHSKSHVSEEQAMEWFNLLDANHDGCVSREEARTAILIAPKLAKDFDEADTNRDGCLTPDEVRALSDRRRAERQARRAAQARQQAAGQAAQSSAPAAAPAP